MKKKNLTPNKNNKVMEKSECKELLYHLANFSEVKDFFKYGTSRSITNLKIRRMSDIKAREALSKKKDERDFGKIAMYIIMMTMVFGIAFIMFTQFMSYTEAQTDLGTCRADMGTLRGQVSECQVKLTACTGDGTEIPRTIIPG